MKFLIITNIIFFIALVTISINGQESISIHKRDFLENKNIKNRNSEFDESGKDIIPLQFNKSELTKTVFGYLPFWEYYNSRNYIRYDLLTHIALFDFTVDSMGNVFNPYYWPWTDVINKAHLNGVKVILTAVNFEPLQIKNIMRNTVAKTNFFNQVKDKMIQYQFDGINIDFEHLKSEDRGAVLNNFMYELTEFINFFRPDAEVSFAGPSINWGGWDLKGLVESCDYIFIMGYSFYGSWSTTSGASAPLSGGTYNINYVVNNSYSWATINRPEKLILGVPYYGEKWKTLTELPHSAVLKYVSSTRFMHDVDSASIYGRLWASDNKVPWYRFFRDTTWYQVWYDDDSSLGLKYDLAESKNYKGIGMWALGYDRAKPQLWNEIEKRYKPLSTARDNIIVTEEPGFTLHQNYPNPFNPSTKIKFQIPNGVEQGLTTTLKVFNTLGEEIFTILNEILQNGSYEVDFNIKQNENLPSGIYYYQLRCGNFVETKKMILLR
ncbi:MAG: glycosyl hydrolase family 18 protein [Ignavibacteria bacterium]|nr:glycosyl hydrolase family 18 protein [Ignavibacteria bacterium]